MIHIVVGQHNVSEVGGFEARGLQFCQDRNCTSWQTGINEKRFLTQDKVDITGFG
jgi:hypothetical protein